LFRNKRHQGVRKGVSTMSSEAQKSIRMWKGKWLFDVVIRMSSVTLKGVLSEMPPQQKPDWQE